MKKTEDQRWTDIIKLASKKGYKPFPSLVFEDVSLSSAYFVGYQEEAELSLEQVIFCHDFAKALWGEGEARNLCDCDAVPGMVHKVDCKSQFCPHCKFRIHIVNPSGFCNHIHYPESCRKCEMLAMSWRDYLQELVLADNYLEYIESTL